MDIQFKVLSAIDNASTLERMEVANFLYEHLDQYGDPKEDILRCIDYALSDHRNMGGFVLIGLEGEEIVGTVVINQTGMSGYIPENILVYIATHREKRGQGLGKKMMAKAIDIAKGDIALHVEADNPARGLYEKMGFTNPYLEMRLKKNKSNA